MLLACPLPVTMPELDVFLKFELADETRVDLSWLAQQPCSSLKLCITLRTALTAQHRMLVDCLLQLPRLHALIMRVQQSMPAEIQQMWAELTVIEALRVQMGDAAFASADQALQALPVSPNTRIRPDFRSKNRDPLFFAWSAVAADTFLCSDGREVHMQGSPPDPTEKPWQLSVHTAPAVLGLWGPCRFGRLKYQNNIKLVAKDWTIAEDRLVQYYFEMP